MHVAKVCTLKYSNFVINRHLNYTTMESRGTPD